MTYSFSGVSGQNAVPTFEIKALESPKKPLVKLHSNPVFKAKQGLNSDCNPFMEQPILYSNRDMPKSKVQISCGIADYSKINPEAHKQLAYQNKTNPGLNAKKNPPPCFNSRTYSFSDFLYF